MVRRGVEFADALVRDAALARRLHARAAAGRRASCRASSITSVLDDLFPGLVSLLSVRRAGQQPAGAAQPRCACRRRGDGAGAATASRPAGRPCRMIVGRDTRDLDEAAVCRAAIESLAENFSDGVVAPLFWMVVAGLPGALAYKAINTADSMIGHKSAAAPGLRLGVGALRRSRQPAGVAALGLVAGAGGRCCSACRRARRWRRCGATPATIARPMPAGRRPRWRARSASGSRVRASTTACAVEERWVGEGRSELDGARHPRGAEALSHGLRPADRRAGRDRAWPQALSPVGSREASTRARIQRREGQHRISMIGMRHSDSADSVCDGSP